MDSDLTEKGIAQAEQMAAYLKKKKIDAVLCSPLGRAIQTAEVFMKIQPEIPFSIAKELAEIDNGDFDGKVIEDLKRDHPEFAERLEFHDLETRLPNGESYNDVKKRIRPFFKRIRKQFAGKNVAIFAHGGVIRMLVGIIFHLSDKKLEKITIPNGVIYKVIVHDDELTISNIKKGNKKQGFVLWKNPIED